jgi:hypothetical protein
MELFALGISVFNDGSDAVKYFDMPAWRGTLKPVSATSKLLCDERRKSSFS